MLQSETTGQNYTMVNQTFSCKFFNQTLILEVCFRYFSFFTVRFYLLEGAALGPVREGVGSQPKPGPSPPSVRVSMSAWSIINSWKKDEKLMKHGSSHETSCIQMDPFPLTFLRGVFCLFRFHLNLRLDQPAEAGEWQWNWLRSFQKIGMWDSGKQLRLEWFYIDLYKTHVFSER